MEPVTAHPSVSWCENRSDELFLMIAEKTPQGWVIFERSTFEVRYYPVKLTANLVATAETALGKKQAGEAAL
jgi:hypothetical protein